MSEYMLCQQLHKQFKGQDVFSQVSLDMKEGEILSLVGPSGTGKSTFLRCIAGLEEVSSGEIIIEGKPVTKMKASKRPVVMMFQQSLLFPHMTILENVMYGLKKQPYSKKERLARAEAFLERVDMPALKDYYPYQCSGGQQQRIALVRALITKPKLLLLDEPFSSLDPDLRMSIRGWVRDLIKEDGMTAIFVTHDKEEAMIVGDTIAVLANGTLQQKGTVDQVYQTPVNGIVAEFFSESIVVDHESYISYSDLKLVVEGEREKIQSEYKVITTTTINKRLMKHGQPFVKVKIAEFNKEIILAADFSEGERVDIIVLRSKIKRF